MVRSTLQSMIAVLGVVALPACKNKPEGGTDPTTLVTTDDSSVSGTGSTGSGTLLESSGSTASSSTGGGVCQGPEHEAYQMAQCPFPYPDCTPMVPIPEWTAYCADNGFGPVGSGECGCTPTSVLCPGNGDVVVALCCCPVPIPGP